MIQITYQDGDRCSVSRPGLFRQIMQHGGGLINTGQHLGLMLGPAGSQCPPGWVFLEIEELDWPGGLGLFSDCLDWATQGRRNWPDKDGGGQPV